MGQKIMTTRKIVKTCDTKRNTMMKAVIGFAFALILFSTPQVVQAGHDGGDYHGKRINMDHVQKQRFVLDFGDAFYSSFHSGDTTLYLKRKLRQQYPGIDVSDYRLKRVVVVAKSKHGKGSVQLRVGPEVSDYYRVYGRPHDFHKGRKQTFDRIKIASPFRDSWGPWQLNLNGLIKVRKVVLVVESRNHHHYGWKDDYERPRKQYRHYHPWDGSIHFNVRW